MRKLIVLRGRPGRRARAHSARRDRWAGPDTRRHSEVDHHRRDVPAHRSGGDVRADPARDEGVLRYVNARRGSGRRPAAKARSQWAVRSYSSTTTTRYNTATTAQLTRRLVEQDKVFATVGDLGTEPRARNAGLHEPAEGAAGTRLHRRHGVRHRSTRSSRGRPAGSPTTSPRDACTVSTSRRTSAGRRSRSCTRTTTTARITCTGSCAALGKKYADANVVAQEAVEATATCVAAADGARSSASGATILAVFQLPTPTIAHDRDRPRRSASTPSRST